MKLSKILFEEMQRVPPEGYVVIVSGDNRLITIKIRTKEKVSVSERFPQGRFKYAGDMRIQRSVWVDNGVVWEVESVVADQGYGPLLYDIAMEVVNKVGGVGLMPDTISVSGAARAVWRKYFEDRSDVEHKLLPEDMFDNTKLQDRPEYMRYYYSKSSTPMIDSLKAKGLIESEDFDL